MGDVPWFQRSKQEFALRAGAGTSRILMARYADADGNGMDGEPATWKDIATFYSYNDAEWLLRKLNGGDP